jgi:hypothetical protein
LATIPPPSSTPTTSSAPRAGASGSGTRRRIPLLLIGAAGAVLAAAYGHFGLGMRVGPPLVMTGLGGLTLVLSAYALWRVVDPLTRDEVRAATEVRAPHRIRELDREKQAVLKAIKEIELDYQMRKISEPDYREMVERYRARALRVMSELAAGDDYRALIERELKDRMAAIRASVSAPEDSSPQSLAQSTPSATPALQAGACAACSTMNDVDARFCKGCGVALAAADAPAVGGPPR